MPGYCHRSVLLNEVIDALQPESSGRYVDGTVGGGGHSEAILTASAPAGWLDGLDRDADAIAAAAERLKGFAGRFALHQDNFADMGRWVAPESAHGVLLDLGVSSFQLDQGARGFSFQRDGPLDMRFDPSQAVSAATWVNEASEAELARIFWELGDESHSRRLARAVVNERQKSRFETTGQLARCLEQVAPRHGHKRHPATRVFMALRMAVNQELDSLQRGLAAAYRALKRGGRMAVITFHSVEDRMVKQFGQEASRPYRVAGTVDIPELRQPATPRLRWITRKPIVPGPLELAGNPRARSAKLRVLEKIA